MLIRTFIVMPCISEKYNGDVMADIRECMRQKFPSFAIGEIKNGECIVKSLDGFDKITGGKIMLGEIVKSCSLCRTKIFVENSKEVEDVVKDGRRFISCLCPVCGTKIDILIKFVPRDETK